VKMWNELDWTEVARNAVQ